jgi:hypothetical protein
MAHSPSPSPTPLQLMQLAVAVYYKNPQPPTGLRIYRTGENQHHGLRFLTVVPDWCPRMNEHFDWATVEGSEIHLVFAFRGTGELANC